MDSVSLPRPVPGSSTSPGRTLLPLPGHAAQPQGSRREYAPELWDQTDGAKVSAIHLRGLGETTVLSGPQIPQ